MQVKTRVKAELIAAIHTETQVQVKSQPKGLKMKTNIKAGSNYSSVRQEIN
jgi:hypothetical protein